MTSSRVPRSAPRQLPVSDHPPWAYLEGLRSPAAPIAAAEPAAVEAHVAGCAQCQADLAFLGALTTTARARPAPDLPVGLRVRVLASRSSGVRRLVPRDPVDLDEASEDAGNDGGDHAGDDADRNVRTVGHSSGWWPPQIATATTVTTDSAARVPAIGATWDHPLRSPYRARSPRGVLAAAAVVLIAIGGAVLVPRADGNAIPTRGSLALTPALPRAGQRVTVRYRPSWALVGQPWVVLRARVRRPQDESYNRGLAVRTLGRLTRSDDGSYGGTFTLPDSAVYAALAVEDSSGATIDADGGRYEVLRGTADGRPTFGALTQRAHDLMGRNWEEGFATAQRMVTLYPDTIAGWSWLRSHQMWLNRGDDDSVRRVHLAQVARFDAQLARDPVPRPADLGLLAWYADGIDTTIARRWRTRLLRDAPTNTFAVQWRLFALLDTVRATHDTARALAALDTLWAATSPGSRRAQVASYTMPVAWSTGDTARIRRWSARVLLDARDSAAAIASAAKRAARDPRMRADGMARLRALLATHSGLDPVARGLTETVAQQRLRDDAARRALFAALGRALVADGALQAGLDTLALATARGWDLDVWRSVRLARLAAGDTVGALAATARLLADPRTPAALADSVRPLAARVFGPVGWGTEQARGHADFVARMRAEAAASGPPRVLNGAQQLIDAAGRPHTMADLMAGRVTVVAFTSRFCGPARADLPRFVAAQRRLAAAGVRVVTVVEEPGPSTALTAFLDTAGVRQPVYFDTRHDLGRALNVWGTPYYYVLDGTGRMHFDPTDSAEEAMARATAMARASSATGVHTATDSARRTASHGA